MAGHASTAGVWPAMSTNVVHMAPSCFIETVHAVKRREIASPPSHCRCCPQTYTPVFSQHIIQF